MTTEEQLDLLVRVLIAGVEMRSAQAAYFKSRTSADLIESKNLEKAFDIAANRALSHVEASHFIRRLPGDSRAAG